MQIAVEMALKTFAYSADEMGILHLDRNSS